MYKPTINYYKT